MCSEYLLLYRRVICKKLSSMFFFFKKRIKQHYNHGFLDKILTMSLVCKILKVIHRSSAFIWIHPIFKKGEILTCYAPLYGIFGTT